MISSIGLVITTGLIYYINRKKYNEFKDYKVVNSDIKNGKYYFEDIYLESLDKKDIFVSKQLMKKHTYDYIPKLIEILNYDINKNIVCKVNFHNYKIDLDTSFDKISKKYSSELLKNYISNDGFTKKKLEDGTEYVKYNKSIYYIETYKVPEKIKCNFTAYVYDDKILIKDFKKNNYKQELNNYKILNDYSKYIFFGSILLNTYFIGYDLNQYYKNK